MTTTELARLSDDELHELAVATERDANRLSFSRVETRRRRRKIRLDCGCWIDGSEPYVYAVWRVASDPRGAIRQRTECEHCHGGSPPTFRAGPR